MTVHVSGLDEGAPIFDEGLAPAKLLELLPGDDEAADPPEFPGGDPVATPDEDPTPLSEDICNCFFLACKKKAQIEIGLSCSCSNFRPSVTRQLWDPDLNCGNRS